jgi:hypothetical protein
MSINSIPNEILGVIGDFFRPARVTQQEVKKCARIILDLLVVNKCFNSSYNERIKDLKNLDLLIAKYSVVLNM